MKYLLSILCFTYVFAIDVTLGDARTVPEFGFNGNTVRRACQGSLLPDEVLHGLIQNLLIPLVQ